jgi:PKD domain/Secretion system C-terminal sorting domain
MNKIRHFLLAAFLLASQVLSAQYSVTFKPDATLGQDAMILRNDVCTNWDIQNYGNNAELDALAWTWYANNCGPGAGRGLVRFDQLNSLPAGAVITYAELRLFGLSTSGNSQGNSSYPGSPHPSDNGAWVRRVMSYWDEGTVTWNSHAASFTTADEAVVPASTLQWNYNVSVDVTNQVIAMTAPGANNGFILMLQDENYYRSLLFASSDHPDATLWPELYIKYDLPCDANFTYCTSTQTPGVYHFKVDNPQLGYNYKWDFGDGATATGTSVLHSYTDGSYQVCLYAYNEATGVECKKCIKICVSDVPVPPCTVKFDYYVNGDVYYFKGYEDGINGPVVSAVWDFGDGSPFTAYNTYWPETKHKFERPGTYLVCVTVKYENGCIAKYCTYITVGNILNKQSNKASNIPKVTNNEIPAGDKVEILAKANVNIPVADNIKVIPNPVELQLIKVNLNVTDAGNYKYSLFNANGKAIISGNKPLNKGQQQVEISIQGVTAGKYWIEFSNGKKQLRASFVRL